ncbi:MAG: CDP-diacylglycerol--glycerol-3-phosphate 3-phosphatidyltransferase [Legionellales bacterium]|nr:CDP-diacylglycerol--glycerol-3-phosphate 3-phosphatidyltransferase [Legionellales bacterium]
MSIPNILTWLRIVLIPVFVITFYLPWSWARLTTAAIFAIAALTDWLDGYLARSLSQTSRLGAFLDPVADKLIVVATLILLVGENHYPYLAIPATVIVGREIVISALREWMAEIGKRASVAVSMLGKLKTVLQMLAILLLLLGRPTPHAYLPHVGFIGYALLYIAAIMTLWSMLVYLRAARDHMAV